MQQVPGPAPNATARCTVRLDGAVVGQTYVDMTAEDWFQLASHPYVYPGDIHQTATAKITVAFEWIGAPQNISVS